MSFDINTVINNMKRAAVDAIKNDVQNIPDYLKQVFENEKESLKALAEARLSGEIPDKIFQSELKREKRVLEAELLTISIMTKALAQKAINAAINVLVDAIKIAI
jgi:sialic acid synthase SpsE